MIYQTNPGFNDNLEHVGCAFCSLAYAREKLSGYVWTVKELDDLWNSAVSKKILSPDFIIQDWDALADHLGCSLDFVGRFDYPYAKKDGQYIITAWHNDRTNFTHFVVGDKKPVEYDPIEGGSVTVREGKPVSHRVFRIKEA